MLLKNTLILIFVCFSFRVCAETSSDNSIPKFELSETNLAQMTKLEIDTFNVSFAGVLHDGQGNVITGQKSRNSSILAEYLLSIDNPYKILLDREIPHEFGLNFENLSKNKSKLPKKQRVWLYKYNRFGTCIGFSAMLLGSFHKVFRESPNEDAGADLSRDAVFSNYLVTYIDYPYTDAQAKTYKRALQVLFDLAWQYKDKELTEKVYNQMTAEYLNSCLNIPFKNFESKH